MSTADESESGNEDHARRTKTLFRCARKTISRSLSGVRSRYGAALPGSKAAWRTFAYKIRHPARGIFPPLGILSVSFLAIITVGIPTGKATEHLWPLMIFLIVAIGAAAWLWATPRERYAKIFAETFGWLPVSLGALTYGYWYWYAEQQNFSPDLEFFHVAAEVLPVLLLASVLDVRRAKDLQSKQLVLPIIAVFLGEIAALNVLAFGNAGPTDFAAVASSFVSSITALVLAVMADLKSSPEDGLDIVESNDPAVPSPEAADTRPQVGDTASDGAALDQVNNELSATTASASG